MPGEHINKNRLALRAFGDSAGARSATARSQRHETRDPFCAVRSGFGVDLPSGSLPDPPGTVEDRGLGQGR